MIHIVVWNIKCHEKRLVTITPSNSWGGAGLLGVTIRLDDYGGADERLIRVLKVEANSPAAICGLVENHDYLLGTTADSFDSISTLSSVLRRHVDRVVEIYVYNTDSDVVRVVALMPTWSWGGNGLLGAELGTGYLHRLPSSSRDTTGSSVERKVRWVGMKPKHPSEQKDFSEQKETLEVEPQLEMEVVDSEAPHEETHKTVQQVADHRIGKQPDRSSGLVSKTRAGDQNDDSAPSLRASAEYALKEPMTADTSEPACGVPKDSQSLVPALDVVDEKIAAQPVQQNTVPHAQGKPVPQREVKPPAQGIKEDATPAPDPASFFACPPPGVTFTPATTSYASQFLPPPPMSHLAHEKGEEVDLR